MDRKDPEESRPPIREQEGWTRQFVASEPRLSEAVQMYEDLGFEVRLEPLHPAPSPGDARPRDGECRRCFLGVEHQYKIIYTRPRRPTG